MLKMALAGLSRFLRRAEKISDEPKVGDEQAPAHMTWYEFDNGKSAGHEGTEGGVIIFDEEHPAGARITLESQTRTARFAITCGVYGTLVHTRFFENEVDAHREYELMKDRLARIAAISYPDEESAYVRAIDDFMDQFP